MAYHLGLFYVLWDNLLILLLPLVVGVVLYKVAEKQWRRTIMIIFVCALLMYGPVVAAILIAPHIGSGWELVDNQIKIRAWGYTNIMLPSAKVLLVDYGSSWRPRIKHSSSRYTRVDKGNGYIYTLANGAQATVLFANLSSEKMLVVYFDKQYYLFIHPDAEKLYQETLKQGAQRLLY